MDDKVFDALGVVFTKQARIGQGIGRFFSRSAPGAGSGLGRRALGIGAAGYGTALGGTHAYNALTRPTPTPEQQFSRHTGAYQQLTSPMQSAIDAATNRGDHTTALALRTRLNNGDFDFSSDINAATSPADRQYYQNLQSQMRNRDDGGSGWLRRTFMPWGAGPASMSMQGHRDAALGVQTQLQGEYDSAMRRNGGSPSQMQQQYGQLQSMMNSPTLMPQDRRSLQMQMDQLRTQMSNYTGGESAAARAIADRMRNLGMYVRPYNTGMPQPGGGPGNYPVPHGPTTRPSPTTMGNNANVSPSMMQTNPWNLDNAVRRWSDQDGGTPPSVR